MEITNPAISWLFVLLGAIALWFAERLLRRSSYSPRIGAAPHCAKCDYTLKGIQSERCPECGAPLGSGGIARGQRRWKPRRLVTGLVLLAAGLLCMLRALTLIGGPLISYLPTSLLIHNLKSPTYAPRPWRN